MSEHDHEEINGSDNSQSSSTDSNQSVEMAKNVGKSAGRKVGGKLGKAAMKKLGKAVAKLVAKVIAKLIALLGPYVLAALAIIILLVMIFSIAFEMEDNKGKEEEYQEEDVRMDNKLTKNDKGEYVSSKMSSANKVVKAFYAYYSQQSYYKVINGKMYKADDLAVEAVKDKYAREKEFMLSPDFIYTMDEYLNKDKFRFPEQFIQPVHHDSKTFELKQLTHKNRLLKVESQAYQEETGIPILGKKELGVWDYGFAPILQYKKFAESRKNVGNITQTQVWDKEKQAFINQKVEGGKKIEENVSGFPKTVYMIEGVTTSIGSIKNQIEHEWRNTGETWTKTLTKDVTVDVRYEEKVDVQAVNEAGLPLYYTVDETGASTKEITTGKTAFPVMTSKTVVKYKKEKKQIKEQVEGYVWSKEPRYVGEPDTSKIVGSRYIEDYLYHYEAQVPNNALGGFYLKERTGKDIKGLESILKDVEEDLGTSSEYDNPQTDSDTNLGALMGVQGGSDNFKRAMQYAPYYQKYGEMYGIDPLLLAAKGAQERGGVHSSVKDAGGAIGISQIQVTYHVNQTKKAFNYQTGKVDTVVATMDKLQNVETNIQIGAMILQGAMKAQKYNPLIGLQGYNYGDGGINKVITAYASSKGTTVDAVKSNPKDTGWLEWRMKVHGTGYGDVQYIEHVLKHYPGGAQKPWIMDAKGNKVYIDGNIKMGAGISQGDTGSNFSILDFIDQLMDKWSELFSDVPKEFSTERVRYSNKQIGNAPVDLINMSLAMKEKKYWTEYDYITPKQWKEKYKLLFSAPPSMTGGAESSVGEMLTAYFPNGYGNVVEKADTVAIPFNGKGISVKAPDGSKVLSIADGVIKEVGRDFVVVDHGNGAVSRYSTLKKVSIEEGEQVKKGATLGISSKDVFLEVLLDGQPTDPSWVVAGGSLTGAFITPAQGRFTSKFGWRDNPTSPGNPDYHTGVDIAAPVGTPILAAGDGVVIDAGYRGAYGNLIHIKHNINGKTMSTVYAHLSSMNVSDGDTVKQGQIIGGMGSTGNSTGSHLHFEIQNGTGRYKDNPLDPAQFVKL